MQYTSQQQCIPHEFMQYTSQQQCIPHEFMQYTSQQEITTYTLYSNVINDMDYSACIFYPTTGDLDNSKIADS